MITRDEQARTQRLGMLGIAASVLLVVSDLILLYVPASADGYHFELLAPRLAEWRIVVGDYLGLAAIPLLLVTLGHLYDALRPAGPVVAKGSVFLLGVAYLLGAAFHHETAAILQLARFPAQLDAARLLIRASLLPLYLVFAAVALLVALWLAGAILTGRTRYPRWVAVCSPIVILPVLMWLTHVTPPVLAGGLIPASANLSVCVFFVVSTLTLASRSAAERRSSLARS